MRYHETQEIPEWLGKKISKFQSMFQLRRCVDSGPATHMHQVLKIERNPKTYILQVRKCWKWLRSNVGPPWVLWNSWDHGSRRSIKMPSLDYSAGNSEGAANPSLFGCVAFEDWRSPTTVICGDSSCPAKRCPPRNRHLYSNMMKAKVY